MVLRLDLGRFQHTPRCLSLELHTEAQLHPFLINTGEETVGGQLALFDCFSKSQCHAVMKFSS